MKYLDSGTEYNIFIRENNPQNVIKIPIVDGLRYYEGRIKQVFDHEKTLNKELTPFYVKSKIRKVEKFRYVLLQRYIKGEYLTLENISDVILEYENLLAKRLYIYKKYNLRIDFLGKDGILNIILYLFGLRNKKQVLLSKNIIIEEGTGLLLFIDNGLINTSNNVTKLLNIISVNISRILIFKYKKNNS